MRAIFLSLLFSCSGAFASDLKVSVVPAIPVVITSNTKVPEGSGYREVYGPWFKANLNLENTGPEPLVVNFYKFIVQSVEKESSQFDYTITGCLPILPGESVTVNDLYVDQLPQSASFEYNVGLTVDGWVGTCDMPHARLSETLQFLTQ